MDVLQAVAGALNRAGISAVLTGGACAVVYSDGACQSQDLDFIIRSDVTRKKLDAAMAQVGFRRDHESYVHPRARFSVEFPRGPLAIGDDFNITPRKLKIGREMALALSPTDSCRDRLAAFYHWHDRQSLDAAVRIARNRRVGLDSIRKWSISEGHAQDYQIFLTDLRLARQQNPTRRSRRKKL